MKEKSQFFAKAERIFAENGLSDHISEEKIEKFEHLTEIMNDTGKMMNITAIKDEDEIISLHYADSLLMLKAEIEQGVKVIDVGCGGGFPLFPISIARPDISVTGIDSTAKKINYINDTARKLGLQNARATSARAEDLTSGAEKSEWRERFDVCTARAVAALPILTELCIPFVKVGGRFIALKSRLADEELSDAMSGIEKLGGKVENVIKTTLFTGKDGEEAHAERNIIIIRKVSPTPEKYPRQYSMIKKKPLK